MSTCRIILSILMTIKLHCQIIMSGRGGVRIPCIMNDMSDNFIDLIDNQVTLSDNYVGERGGGGSESLV